MLLLQIGAGKGVGKNLEFFVIKYCESFLRRNAGGDENRKINFMWPKHFFMHVKIIHIVSVAKPLKHLLHMPLQ